MKTATGCLALLALGLSGACVKTRACKAGTVLVSVTFDVNAAVADTLSLEVTIGSTTLTAQQSHPSGSQAGTIELDFPRGYPVGQTMSITLIASANGQAVGQASNDAVALSTGCTALALNVTSTTDGTGDMATQDDLTAATPPDMTRSPCSAVGAKRCNPINHSFEQVCDGSMHWQDTHCMITAAAPIYACTGVKSQCIDTGWAQWSYTTMPNPRFSTIADPAGKGETIIEDLWTGLYWQLETPAGTYTWTQAQMQCAALSYGGFSGDWRLASPIELSTLLDHVATTAPTVQYPFVASTVADIYWASAPSADGSPNAWLVDFSNGNLYYRPIGNAYRVRCVR
jgi:hypothetical protein